MDRSLTTIAKVILLESYTVFQVLIVYSLSALCFPWLFVLGLVIIQALKDKNVYSNILKHTSRGFLILPLVMWLGPLFMGTIFIAYIVSAQVIYPPGTIIGFVLLTSLFLTGAIMFCTLYLYFSPKVPTEEREFWTRRFVFQPLISIPHFWYEFMWKLDDS